MNTPKNIEQFHKVCVIATLICIPGGCATVDYHYGTREFAQLTPLSTHMYAENQVTMGGHHPHVDRIESLVQTPRKWMQQLRKKPEPSQSDIEFARQQSIELSQQYLSANGMNDVYIDVQRYEPAEQWARLKANDEIAPIWKYTGGTLDWAAYTLFPKRALHADSYDPFTNTLNLNSARSVSALYFAADAKQHDQQKYKGAYGVAQRLPLVPLFHTVATASEAISYARASSNAELERQMYPAAYGRMGSTAIRQVLTFGAIGETSLPTAPLLGMVGRGVGAAAGAVVASQQLPPATEGGPLSNNLQPSSATTN